MIGRTPRQPRLLDRYWSALRFGSGQPSQPPGLDPDLARMAEVLARESAQLEPGDAFLNDLRRQLASQATSGAGRGWTMPALDPRARPLPVPDDTEEHDMSRPSSTQLDEPIDIRPRIAREWLKLAAAVLVFVLIGTVLVLTFRDDDNDQVGVPPPVTPTVSPTPASTVPATTTTEAAVEPTSTIAATATATTPFVPTPFPAPPGPVAGEVAAYIPLAFEPADIARTADALWVSGLNSSVITRIDPRSGDVVATIDLGAVNPERSVTVAYLEPDIDGVWAYREPEQTLVKIDAASNQIVTSIQLPGDGDVPFDLTGYAITSDAIWASDFNGRVVRVDLESGTVVASIETVSPQRAFAAYEAIWVTNYDANTVTRIDPTTNQITAVIDVGGGPVGLAAGAGSIWVANRGGESISRIDPATNQVTATITVPLAGSAIQRVRPWVIDGSDDALWVTDENGGNALYRIDPVTNTVVGTLMTPAGNVVVGEDGIWVAVAPERVILRITPSP